MYITCKRLLNVECVSGNLKLAIVFLNGISSNKLLGAYWKEVTKSRGEHLLSSPVVNQAYQVGDLCPAISCQDIPKKFPRFCEMRFHLCFVFLITCLISPWFSGY